MISLERMIVRAIPVAVFLIGGTDAFLNTGPMEKLVRAEAELKCPQPPDTAIQRAQALLTIDNVPRSYNPLNKGNPNPNFRQGLIEADPRLTDAFAILDRSLYCTSQVDQAIASRLSDRLSLDFIEMVGGILGVAGATLPQSGRTFLEQSTEGLFTRKIKGIRSNKTISRE